MDAICLGELLIDFVSPDADVALGAATRFVKAPGGAPANVAVALARLGLKSAFVGCVGRDPFGDFLSETLREAGVDVSRLRRADEARTTLAFVATHTGGAKDIAFWRGADATLTLDDLDRPFLHTARLFHFCSVSLSRQPVRAATLSAAAEAKAGGALISFDPNWRAPLWEHPEEGHHWIAAGVELADVVKVADEELELVCGTTDVDTALHHLLARGPRLAVLTFGAGGALAATRTERVRVPGFPVTVKDTLGAGDAFVAALLSRVLSWRGLTPGEADLREALTFANAAGALTTRTVGVIPALPTTADIEAFLAGRV